MVPHQPAHKMKRTAVVSVHASTVAEARKQAETIPQDDRQVAADQWKVDNRKALESSNDYFDQHGLPLGKFRPF